MRRRPLRQFTLISVLLVLVAGSFACAPSQVETPGTAGAPVRLTPPPPGAAATPVPGRLSEQGGASTAAAPAPVSGTAAGSGAPLPTPTATAVPEPSPTPAPSPSPTSTAEPTRVHRSPGEEEARFEEVFENLRSVSYEATFDMPVEFTEGGYPIEAAVSGWGTMGTAGDPTSQFVMKMDMTRPIRRSIEVVSRPNSFSMYLHDLDADRWYFLPENSSEVDTGPVEDISHLWFNFQLFSLLPREDARQTPDGYVREVEIPDFGVMTVTYDREYTVETLAITGSDGRQFLRARYFDINRAHDLAPYEPVEDLLPDTYWSSQ